MAVKKLSNDETAYFCEQLALMLNAGMDIGDGMEIIAGDIDEKALKAACAEVSESVKQGNTIFDSMSECGVFPEYAIKMVKIGSVTGRLEDVLNGLREYYEERANTMRMVRSAVLHPLILLVMMTVVMIVLIVLVIPMFNSIFMQFDSSVSEMVSSTVTFAYNTGIVIMIVLLVLIAAVLAVVLLTKIPAARRALSRFASVFPLTRGFALKFARAKAASALSIMVSAGISTDEALELAEKLVDDTKLGGELAKCHKRVIDGEPFAEIIGDAGIFPALLARSLKIAYTAGSFEQAWRKISEKCSEETTDAISTLLGFVEPALIVVLVTMIGAILLTIMLPLMNIMSVLG